MDFKTPKYAQMEKGSRFMIQYTRRTDNYLQIDDKYYITLYNPVVVYVVGGIGYQFFIRKFFNPENVHIKYSVIEEIYDRKVKIKNKKSTLWDVLNNSEGFLWKTNDDEYPYPDSILVWRLKKDRIFWKPYEYENMDNPDVDVDITLEELF